MFPPMWNYGTGNLMEAAIKKKKIPKVIVTRLETVIDEARVWMVNGLIAYWLVNCYLKIAIVASRVGSAFC